MNYCTYNNNNNDNDNDNNKNKNNNIGFKSLFQNSSNDLQNVLSQIFIMGESSFSENKNVFSSDLKTFTVFAFFTLMGSRFHKGPISCRL